MPADDHPFDALQKQFDLEDASVSPVNKAILYLASSVPLPWPIDKAVGKIKEHLGADSLERIRIMLETCMNEVRKHDDEIRRLRESMSPEEADRRAETSKELLLDGARKAEATRAKDRVKRIGLILANTMVASKPTDLDEVDEMMRVAMELSNRDIEHLRELLRIEGKMLETADHINRYSAHTAWEQGSWGTRVDPELDSVFSKLD